MTTLRVALIAGSLTQGGAERQLIYLVQALTRRRVEVQVFTLTRDEHYERDLAATGARVTWVGQRAHPAARLLVLRRHLSTFRPHVVQSTHFFTNLYAALLARGRTHLGIGALRNDVHFEVAANGAWGPWLLRLPPLLLANSDVARHNAMALGRAADTVFVLSNAIDVADFDRRARLPGLVRAEGEVVATVVARLVEQKRIDRFLDALAFARRRQPALRGVVVGDGPERSSLEQHARTLGLDEPAVTFVGRRDDVPALLRTSDMLVLTSAHEGTPNVILEAMAAGVPVVTTKAGGAGDLVTTAGSGLVVEHADGEDAIGTAVLRMAQDSALRARGGAAGRAHVIRHHDLDSLGDRALDVYRRMAGAVRATSVARCFAA